MQADLSIFGLDRCLALFAWTADQMHMDFMVTIDDQCIFISFPYIVTKLPTDPVGPIGEMGISGKDLLIVLKIQQTNLNHSARNIS